MRTASKMNLLAFSCNDATTLSALSAEGPQVSIDDWAIELSRAGLAAILLVGLLNFILGDGHDPQFSPALHLLQGANLALIGITFALTWHAIYRRHWRIANFVVCLAVMASEAAIGIDRGDAITFVVAATLLLAGTAALTQWLPWRQFAAPDARDDCRESDLMAARDGAQAALRAKSDFLSQMSHEIRTPMNAILGMAELLNDTELSPEQHKYLSVMMNNGAALLDLIDDILDFARIESGRLNLEAVNFDLLELAERVAETLSIRAHQKGLELTLRVAPGVPTALVGDPLRLRQVLINLVANAIKFTDHGEVTIAIERASDAAGALHCSVSDTGIGIAADQREKIFSRYTQASPATAREYGGTGLGLAIVKQLVELMGGRIWIDSEIGRGSTFHFIVRFALQPGGNTAATADAVPELAGLRVLIADRTAITRFALAEALGECGARVTQMQSGEQAIDELRRADEEGTPYRIVLLDCRMPAIDGTDPVRRICEAAHGAGMVIPMLTSDDLNVRLPRLRKFGLVHQIIKPVRRSELFSVIRAMLGYDSDPANREHHPTSAEGIASASPVEAEDRRATLDSVEPIAHGVNITSIGPVEQIGEARKVVAPSQMGRALRILVADDSADNRLLIQAFLKQTACLVEQAENGEIALEKFVGGNYDVILMDIQMPVMDGYTAAKLIRQWEHDHNARRTPIIALTASVLDEAVHKSFDAGCDTHVAKPVRRPTLLAAIHEVTAKSELPEEAVIEAHAGVRELLAAAEQTSEAAVALPLRVARSAGLN